MSKKLSHNANQLSFDFRESKTSSTELKELRPFEIVNYILHNNPAFKRIGAIATECEVETSTAYRWGENPKASGINLLDERLIKFIKATRSLNLIIRYIRARCEQ